MREKNEENIYLRVPIEQCRADALHGVSAAREAWRLRQPEQAARALGAVREPQQQDRANRIIGAVGDFLSNPAWKP